MTIKDLERKGAAYRAALAARDTAIRTAHDEGMSLRQIAAAVGLTHAGVARIIKRG